MLYYIIYNSEFWQCDGHQPFEVYKLIGGQYQLQIGEPFWRPEVGLGIGRHSRSFGPVEQEMLYWFDENNQRYLAADEQAEQERQQREQLLERLREMGIDPETLQ